MNRNITIIVIAGAIVAIAAMTASVTIALCTAQGPTDHTPVATTVLTGFATTLAALMAILKGIMNGQQQKETQCSLKENTEITAAVATAVGAKCKGASCNDTNASQPAGGSS